MSRHIQTGKEGEKLATEYLTRKGYDILFCNWRFSHYEIDIVALKEQTVHFIEVKTRRSLTFGHPEESVSRKKFQSLKGGAVAFQVKYPFVKKIQFDILSITRLYGKEDEYFFIEDVYIN